MDFFDSQARANRNTRYLLLLMTLAVGAVVLSVTAVIAATLWLSTINSVEFVPFIQWLLFNSQLLLSVAFIVTAFIGIASLYRVFTLRQGGSRVALDLGGTAVSQDDNDPLRRRLRNVIEEMAIASGVAVPEIFVLDHEAGINAFAAGFRPEDAAIAVTRGTLETLSRDELQGVIGHEFSHVLNGDMRLNIRLMGPLFGILSIGLLGKMLLRSNRRRAVRNKGASAAMFLGAGLTATGFVGLLIGRIIKAGVSRQREYLADASAVQFTRQTNGIAGALKKIAGFDAGSDINSADAEEVSHMLFARGLPGFSSVLASHPPLIKRIQALEPGFTDEQLQQLQTTRTELDTKETIVAGLSGFTADKTAASINADVSADPEVLLQTIGRPDDHHINAARSFLHAVPAALRSTLSTADTAILLPPAMLLHPSTETRQSQLAFLVKQLGEKRANEIEKIYLELQIFRYEARLPLLEIALPVIKLQPPGRIDYLNELLEQLAALDNKLELFEYALLRIFQRYMQNAMAPGKRQRWENLASRKMLTAAGKLITVFGQQTNANKIAADSAINKGLHVLFDTPPAVSSSQESDAGWLKTADNAIQTLLNCTPKGRQQVIKALLTTALANGHINRSESELMRAFCLMLDCPLPPIIAHGHSG